MRSRLFAALTFCVCLSRVCATVVETLIVPPEGGAPGQPLLVNWVLLNSGVAQTPLAAPDKVEATLRQGSRSVPVELSLVSPGATALSPGSFAYRTYSAALPPDATGEWILEVPANPRLRAVVNVTTPAPPNLAATAAGAPVPTAPLTPPTGEPAIAQIQRSFLDRFATHNPIYFAYGFDDPAAKFQFSFKYRLLGENSALGSQFPALHSLYFGYTQRSLWDFEAESSPFYDTEYTPEIMFESLAPRRDGTLFQWLGYQAGVLHESNGRDGPESQSMNVAYVRPMIGLGRAGEWNLVFAPRMLIDVTDRSENRDLRRYRGFGDYTLVLTKNDSLSVAVIGRIGSNWGKGSVQVDVNYPVRFQFGNFATFLLAQYFNGYGESIGHYNEKSEQFRLGFGLVR